MTAPSRTVAADRDADDTQTVAALRAGDETAFLQVVERYHGLFVRLAGSFVPDRDAAELVAQDAWLAVLGSLDRYEQGAALRTWMCRIVLDTARSRARGQRPTVPFGAPRPRDAPAADPDWFVQPDEPGVTGSWRSPPACWDGLPERELASRDLRERIGRALDRLPAGQRAVVQLRDV